MSEEETLAEHPCLEKDEFAAVYVFAGDAADAAYGRRSALLHSSRSKPSPKLVARRRLRAAPALLL
jgi:hypothetical protein